jgi:hypothetical protein
MCNEMKRVIVNSHERTGTHFLMNTIADNFGYQSYPWIDFDHPFCNHFISENILTIFNAMANNDKTQRVITKSHFNCKFFEEILDKLHENFHIFYIYRDTEPTLRSFMKHINDAKEHEGWDFGTVTKTYEEFKNTQPWGACLRYQYQQYPNMVERFKDHVLSWLDREHVIYVKYEELNENFNETVIKIEKEMDMPLFHGQPIRPTKGRTIQKGKISLEELTV